jgi:hypothetical protein
MTRRIQNHPDLELVGVHCHPPDKVGSDSSEIANLGLIGVAATGNVEEILNGRPPGLLDVRRHFARYCLCVQAVKVDMSIVTTDEPDHRTYRTKDVDIGRSQLPADMSFRTRAARAGRRAALDRG